MCCWPSDEAILRVWIALKCLSASDMLIGIDLEYCFVCLPCDETRSEGVVVDLNA